MDTITFYHTATCPQCRMVKMLLDKNEIPYIPCLDVEKMKEKGIMHTPAIELQDGSILQGTAIKDWLNQNKK